MIKIFKKKLKLKLKKNEEEKKKKKKKKKKKLNPSGQADRLVLRYVHTWLHRPPPPSIKEHSTGTGIPEPRTGSA